MRHIIPISGKDSLATAIIQTAHEPEIEYQFVFNETGWELPPVYEWLQKVEKHFGKSIIKIGANLTEIIAAQGILPSQRARFCTRLAKIQPTSKYLGKDEAIVYYGLRADESDRAGHNGSGNIIPQYPLRKFNLGLPQVWAIGQRFDLLPPFFEWPELKSRIREKIGNEVFLAAIARLAPWDYQAIFSWKWRQFNCAACIYSRQYEIIGLHDFYPEIFEKIAIIEDTTGADGFTLQPAKSMREIIDNRDQIIDRRVGQIIKILYKLIQDNIFENHLNPIEQTSCGLLCGK